MIKKSWYPTFFVFLIVTFQFSCSKKDPAPSFGKDVYVSGFTGAAPNVNAAYWKNETITQLSNPTNAYSFANDILVVGNDVYVVGGLFDANLSVTAVYWKNGAMTKLSNDVSQARAIASNGTDIFIAGSNNGFGGYWQNGNFIPFVSGSIATDITVSGSDVYAVGLIESSGNISPLYWKNGVSTNLPGIDGSTQIAVGSSGVYICGNVSNEYWSNGTETNVPDAQFIFSITTSGADVYFSGQSGGNPVYWKNGVVSKMDNTALAVPSAIQVSGPDVYVIGNSGSSGNYSAIFWKNGISTKLSASTACRANGLFVN